MRRSVGRNALANLSGSALQLAVALVTTPLYIHRIGADRYGILAIVWIFLFYFGLFDMGLGSATTMLVAKLRDATRRSSLFWTALTLNVAFGSIGALVLVVVGRALFARIKMPHELRPEVTGAIEWLALALIVAVCSSVIAGATAGRERFITLSACQLVGTLSFTIAPLIVAYAYGPDLRRLIPAAVIGRICGTIPLAVAAWRIIPLGAPRFEPRWVKLLLGFGGWVSVTNLISPLLVGVDRVLIGAIRGSAAVAYYTVPFNLAARLSVVPSALASVLFPRFSTLRPDEAAGLARNALLALAAVMTPVVIIGMFVMKSFLWHWVGPRMADTSAPVGVTIMLGAWVNGMAFIPYALLNGSGKPAVIARFHLVELVPFIAILWFLLRLWGIEGAAWAWTLRVTADTALLFWAARLPWRTYLPLIPPTIMVVASAAAIPQLEAHSLARLIAGGVAIAGSSIWALGAAPAPLKGRVLGLVQQLLVASGRLRLSS